MILLSFWLLAAGAFGQEPGHVTLTAVTHIHSNFSHGSSRDLDALAGELRAKGVDVFITTDHLLSSWSYGLWPLRRLLAKRVDDKSVLKAGAAAYLEEIGRVCLKLDGSLGSLVDEAAPLTEYAWKYRYPGEPDQPTRVEAEEALRLASSVCEAIVARLPAEARP